MSRRRFFRTGILGFLGYSARPVFGSPSKPSQDDELTQLKKDLKDLSEK